MKSESHLGHHWSWPNHINFLAAARKPAVADTSSSQNTFFHWLNFQGDFLAGQRKNLELSSWPSWHSRPDQQQQQQQGRGRRKICLAIFFLGAWKTLCTAAPWQQRLLDKRTTYFEEEAYEATLLLFANFCQWHFKGSHKLFLFI